MGNRIRHEGFKQKIKTAHEAALTINNGENVATSGFTGAGYPKELPNAIAAIAKSKQELGEEYKINIFTGASTAPEFDGVLAQAQAVGLRLPFQSDKDMRNAINKGGIDYVDIHLGHVSQHVEYGHYGDIDTAIIEVVAINEDGTLVPSSSVGNNKTWLDKAKKIIIEVNSWQPIEMSGMHDIYYDYSVPPNRKPIPLTSSFERIGEKFLRCDLNKVVAVVEVNSPDRNSAFTPADEGSKLIAQHLIDFLKFEVSKGRLPSKLLPLQSGVGNIANAVLVGLADAGFKDLEAYTEVIQDGMLDLLKSGVIKSASATSFSLSPDGIEHFKQNIGFYREKILLRPQEISNHSEIIRRLGCIAMNGIIEADIYGNINSTHIMGSKMQNGIGGSGDFTRNGFLSMFMTPSVAKGGDISAIVPMVSHHDHTEHDVTTVITEQGLADLRGLSPKKRAKTIIEKCAHPTYRDQLTDYFERAQKQSSGLHTPHILPEALSWHQRFLDTGSMLIK